MGCVCAKKKQILIESNPNTREVRKRKQNDIKIDIKNMINKNSSHYSEDYKIIKIIGRGTFGTVYKIINKNTGAIRAMKSVKKSEKFDQASIIEEIQVLKETQHPHIIKIY